MRWWIYSVLYSVGFNLEYQLKVKEDELVILCRWKKVCCHSVHHMMTFQDGYATIWNGVPFLCHNKKDSVTKHSVRSWMWCHHITTWKYSVVGFVSLSRKLKLTLSLVLFTYRHQWSVSSSTTWLDGIPRLENVNRHSIMGSVIVPTQPFGFNHLY